MLCEAQRWKGRRVFRCHASINNSNIAFLKEGGSIGQKNPGQMYIKCSERKNC